MPTEGEMICNVKVADSASAVVAAPASSDAIADRSDYGSRERCLLRIKH